MIEDELTLRADALGVQSFKTEHGIAFMKTKDFVSVTNWDTFVKEMTVDILNQTLSALLPADIIAKVADKVILEGPIYYVAKHVSKTTIKEYMDDNKDQPPEGVRYTMQESMQVRRPNLTQSHLRGDQAK